MRNPWERKGIVWPILLILAGTVLMLNNLGMLEWSLWELAFELWPVILLGIGIDLLVPRRSAWGFFLALALILGAFLGGFWLFSVAQPAASEVTSFSEPLGESRSAQLILKPAVGRLRLHPGSEADHLATVSVNPERAGQVEIDRTQRGSTAVLEVSGRPRRGTFFFVPSTQIEWEISVNREIPIRVDANMGVGVLEFDLAQLDVTEVRAQFGVGVVECRLPSREMEVSIDGGVGQITLVVPRGASVRIAVSRGPAALDLPSGYSFSGGVATSPAAIRGVAELEIRVNLGVGSIRIAEGG